MSPIRKTDDFRSVQIDSWEEYVQEEIERLHLEGELENLPDRGKPIKIWQTDVNPEYDLAFSRLKNAGVMPLWMELDKEIGRRTEELWARLDAVESRIHSLIDRLKSVPDADPEPDMSVWQRFRSWFWEDFSDNEPEPPTLGSIMAMRDRERTRFLELAAELDKKIATYHDSLPKGGEHLQRLRWLPERAARVFDERITLTRWWEEARIEKS